MTTDAEIIELKWRELLNDAEEDANEFVQRIAECASHEPALRRLYPYASLNDLRFSRKTQYPYDRDLPYVATTPFGEHEAAWNGKLLGKGDLKTVVRLVAQALEGEQLR
jgi:hypothetical protein